MIMKNMNVEHWRRCVHKIMCISGSKISDLLFKYEKKGFANDQHSVEPSTWLAVCCVLDYFVPCYAFPYICVRC